MAYGVALGHERFGPRELLEQAVEAERAGFDFVGCSDHLTPWWDPASGTPAHCANAWVWLGAAGQSTSQVSLGPAVSAVVHRYNPVVMAQQAAALELINPGRAFLAVGSGEAMNEVPAGMRWPSPATQLARTAEATSMPASCERAGRDGQLDVSLITLHTSRERTFAPRASDISNEARSGLDHSTTPWSRMICCVRRRIPA